MREEKLTVSATKTVASPKRNNSPRFFISTSKETANYGESVHLNKINRAGCN